MQGSFGEKHLHGIDPKGRLQLSRQIRDQLKLKKGERLHLLPNIEEPPYLEVRTAAQWEDYEQRFLAQALALFELELVTDLPRQLQTTLGVDAVQVLLAETTLHGA